MATMENSAILQLQNVGFDIGGQTILNAVNLGIARGEFKLITGPSGCGKSTLLKIIASLQSPTSGQIFFAGKDINELTPETYRQQVSYCAQTPALFGDSVYDNLVFPWQIRHKQPDPNALVADLLRFGLAENTLEKSINELSGGEKQRVAIARTLLKNPPILILDEATSSLDTKSERAVQAGLEELMEGRTTLIIAHRLSTISSVDRIITLREGRIDEIGTPAELATTGGIYAELLALQGATSKADKAKLARYDIVR